MFLLYGSTMSAKPVQVSIDETLLARVDADPEVQERGRSAFVRSAIELYLSTKERRRIDDEIRRAYAGQADAMLEEVVDLVRVQAWPEAVALSHGSMD